MQENNEVTKKGKADAACSVTAVNNNDKVIDATEEALSAIHAPPPRE